MEVILKQDIKNLGFADEIVKSSNGCILAEKTLPVALITKFKKAGAKILDLKILSLSFCKHLFVVFI